MSNKDLILIEDYLIVKGINAVLSDVDKIQDIRRQELVKEYIDLTEANNTRISYWKDCI